MREWGWTCPILVDESNTVIAGHARIEAARRLGWTEVPVVVARGWSEAQKKAYVLADNKLAENAGWDREKLVCELEELRALAFDVTLTGFGADELSRLLRSGGLTDPDEVPAVEEVVTVPGDVWILGEHRVVCGDATRADVAERCLGDLRM
jgi:ParB-like chromosome segregation protein Spo0J